MNKYGKGPNLKWNLVDFQSYVVDRKCSWLQKITHYREIESRLMMIEVEEFAPRWNFSWGSELFGRMMQDRLMIEESVIKTMWLFDSMRRSMIPNVFFCHHKTRTLRSPLHRKTLHRPNPVIKVICLSLGLLVVSKRRGREERFFWSASFISRKSF